MGEVNFTPNAPIAAQTNDTVTYKLNKEQAAPINKCGFDLQSANSIMVEVPKNNKDGSFILGTTRRYNMANDDIQTRDYCAFDGKNITSTQVIENLDLGNTPDTNIVTKCDVKPNNKTIEFNCRNSNDSIYGLHYFQNKE